MKTIRMKMSPKRLKQILAYIERSPHFHMISNMRTNSRAKTPPPARNKP